MKRNDISNRCAPTVGIRVEDFLVVYKNNTIFDKFANFVAGKENRAEFDQNVLWAVNYIFRHTDMTVDLIVDDNNFNEYLLRMLQTIPYGRIIPVEKPVRIAIMLNSNDIMYYVDSDPVRMSLIGHKQCITLEQLKYIIR